MPTRSDWERLRIAALELVSAQRAMDALHADVDIANDEEGVGIIVTRRFASAGIRRDQALAALRDALAAVEPPGNTAGIKPATHAPTKDAAPVPRAHRRRSS